MGWLSLLVLVAACLPARAQTPTYKLGRTPSAEEIRAADTAVGPAGKELPPGRGTAQEGAKLFAQKCAPCHGPTGAEGPLAPRLVGGVGTMNTPKPVRTIGSYWPFATTIWDFINRAMPLNQEGTLKPDEVYALTAFLLSRNGIIQETDVLDAQRLPQVKMPNREMYRPPPISEWKPGMPRRFRIDP